jgi:hypothetical protein
MWEHAMPQLFHPVVNTVARLVLVGGPVIAVICGILLAYGVAWSDWVTYHDQVIEQPIPFSHQHHVAGLGIDCRYCHTSVENSQYAGIPPTKTCMTCHSQIWLHAPMLQPVRDSWTTAVPIQWTRVHDLPDYVYFDHSIHIAKGVGCSTCHGDVSQMPLIRRVVNLQMRWCIDCHREPEKHLRPHDQIFNTAWHEPPDQLATGQKLLEQYHVQKSQLTNCSLCHR